MSCSFDVCDRDAYAKGWCEAHYRQVVRNGQEPRVIRRKRNNWFEEDCFWDDVDIQIDGCWNWLGVRAENRGKFRQKDGKLVLAHRWSYQFCFPDENIDGVTIHHKCANSLCVNPDHLQPLSLRENVAEMHERQFYIRRIAELEAENERLRNGCACKTRC